MFAIPPAVFNDRPDYMRIPESGVQRVEDGDGNDVYTVRVEDAADEVSAEATALQELQAFLESESELAVFRAETVRNTRGRIAISDFE